MSGRGTITIPPLHDEGEVAGGAMKGNEWKPGYFLSDAALWLLKTSA